MEMKTEYFIVTLDEVGGDFKKMLKIFELIQNAEAWFAKPKHKTNVNFTAELSYPVGSLKICMKSNSLEAIELFESELGETLGA